MCGFYGEDLTAVHAAGFTGLALLAARELIARLPRPGKIVEFGCGDGTTATELCDAGHQLRGFDVSEAMIKRATQREPRATFKVGSFADVPIPPCVAIIAIGEVFSYIAPAMSEPAPLDLLFARCREALEPGGLLMFDLADPRRPRAGDQRGWTAGHGWVVLVDSAVDSDTLTRRIITFRECGRTGYRRSDETHRLRLHRPADVLAVLRRSGFTARTLRAGYGGIALPPGLVAYVARRE